MGLFGRARQMIQGWSASEPPAPQYYRVPCPQGHILQGLRTEGFQALRCTSCGDGVFVLPLSPLPEPAAPASRAKATPADRAYADEDRPIELSDPVPYNEPEIDEVEWVDSGPSTELADVPIPEPEPEPSKPARPAPRPAPAQARPAARPPQASQAPARPRPVAAGPRDNRPQIALPEPSGGLGAWAYRRRHGLVFVGVLGLVLISGFFAVRRRWLEDAPRAVEVARAQGIEFLESGRFDDAYRLLSQGAKAADSLGGAHQGAEAVRQAAAEAAVIVKLVNKPLDELVEEAARYDPPSKWEARFGDFYRGQTVLVEARVLEAASSPEKGVVLDLWILTGRGPQPTRTARIDATGLELFANSPPPVGTDILFGARLDSLKLDPDGQWVFRLMPKSGVWITHRKALLALGWPDPEAVVPAEAAGAPPARPEDGSLRNFTDAEVRSLRGEPEHRARLATQGQLIEQWIYRGLGDKDRQILNFRRQAGDLRMVVVSEFSIR